MDWKAFISQYDVVYETPPSCWQDGLLMGNGSLGAVFYAPEALEWVVNKTDVLDARINEVRRIIGRDEAEKMVREGAKSSDFEREELGPSPAMGLGPKSCCTLTMDLAMGSSVRSALPSVKSRLSLYDATVSTQLDKHLCHPRVESFVMADENALVIRVRDVSPIVSPATSLHFTRPEDVELDQPEMECDGDTVLMKMQMPEAGRYAAGIREVPRLSTAYRDDIIPRIRKQYRPPEVGSVQSSVAGRHGILRVNGDFDVYIAVVTSLESDDPMTEVIARLERLSHTDYEVLRHTHEQWWSEFWQKSWVELGDKPLEQLFYTSLYALGCSYRYAPISGLLGLFYGPSVGAFQMSPWKGEYTQDLNIQCPFFPVHALNHSEIFDAYMDTYDSFLPNARKAARDVWSADGAHFGITINAMGLSATVLGGNRFYTAGSYVALMHCLCWKYVQDEERLRTRIYPFLKEILAFYLHIMNKGADGKYHLWPVQAFELDILDCADPVQTVSMLKVCLTTAIEASELLQIDKELARRWREVLADLSDYPTGVDDKGRSVVVDGVGIPATHHVGQAGCLHPVYPCGEIDEFAEQNVLAMYNDTLDSVVDKTAIISYADECGFHYGCAWLCFFRAMTALRLGRVEEFWSNYIPMFLRAYSKPNGLISHDAAVVAHSDASESNLANIPDESLMDVGEQMPKFEAWCGHGGGASPNPRCKEKSVAVIESSSDYLTMTTEALLQSHNGIIRVFPGWPKDKDAQFVNLIAEGNIAVSSRLVGGEVEFVSMQNRQSTRIEVRLKSPRTGETLLVVLNAGEAVLLRSNELMRDVDAPEQKPLLPIEPAQPRLLCKNVWLGRPNFQECI
ncbi:MAG: hypothetical protein M1133_06955 [Armatimonadetes bacterium]|nr:hypothetical protein [Armatimonadota bacterium]